jgi:hypothetical protein
MVNTELIVSDHALDDWLDISHVDVLALVHDNSTGENPVDRDVLV